MSGTPTDRPAVTIPDAVLEQAYEAVRTVPDGKVPPYGFWNPYREVGEPTRWGFGIFAARVIALLDLIPRKTAAYQQREAERAALREMRRQCKYPSVETLSEWIDTCYPALPDPDAPPEPPPLALSTGEWMREMGGGWQLHENVSIWIAPQCATIADCDALAAWLRQWGER